MVIQKSEIWSFHSNSCPKKLVPLGTWLAHQEGEEKMMGLKLTKKDLEQNYMRVGEKTLEWMRKVVMKDRFHILDQNCYFFLRSMNLCRIFEFNLYFVEA